MAEEHGGQQGTSWPWLKLFSAFKIAILPSKLFLAAMGILVMALGWNILGWIFYSLRPEPQFKDYDGDWKAYTRARASWNLFYEMAGPKDRPLEAEDLGKISKEEYLAIKERVEAINKFNEKFMIVGKDIKMGANSYAFSATDENLAKLADKKFKIGDIHFADPEKGEAKVAGIPITLPNKSLFDAIKGAKDPNQVLTEGTEAAKKAYELTMLPTYKPYGYLRSWPWSEYRGPNPFLVITEEKFRKEYFSGFFSTQVPVLLEPLVKFFAPIAYFLHPNATFGTRFYLLLLILWTLATWALFGGAITRIAVVQAARPNEKVGMVEAIRFARSRLQSLFSAPLIPLFFLAFLTLIMIFFGFIEGFTYFLGDVLAFLFWPLFLILGLIMTVVLVGLIGWPLMYATISAEGSDSFDALSRSYSYVFQGIWRYLWYCLVAVAYGCVLVFFVTLMGSLMVYMGKWGVSQAPFIQKENPKTDRDPTYFFVHAPRSFGWRDLLLYGSHFKTEKEVIRHNGKPATEIILDQEYRDAMSWHNTLGSYLVSFWLYLLFLMMLGFSYSYFWTASSIIYLLMRKYVDDTEFDEIHLDEDEEEPMPEMPVSVPPSSPSPPAAPGFTLVDPPTLRTPTPPPMDSPPPPPRSANPTMLARDEPPSDSTPPPPPENPPPHNP